MSMMTGSQSRFPIWMTVHALREKLLGSGNWTEVVGGLRSVAVQFDPALLLPEEAARLLTRQLDVSQTSGTESGAILEIPVCYDRGFAFDIEMIADELGMSVSEFTDWHRALDFKVSMLGFMPGFAYLKCSVQVPDIGRLPQPRQLVPAGSIGLIGSQSCIYSFNSPGGWPIVGRTPVRLFDQTNDPPTLLSAGQSIQFVPINKSEFEALS